MSIDYSNAARPADWRKISGRIRFDRASNRCECEGECGRGHAGRCTAVNYKPHPETGGHVILTVAHLCARRACRPKCGDESHLKAHCQACHLSYDREDNVQKAARTRRQRQIEAGQMMVVTEVTRR